MASRTSSTNVADSESEQSHVDWAAGLVGGVVGTVAFGIMLTVMMTDVIEVAIPSMYGLAPPRSGVAGWLVHLGHGAILGVVFAGLVSVVGLQGQSAGRQIAAGVLYGALLWVVLAAIVMPIWLSTVGSPASPPLPNFEVQSLVGHLVYGVFLGAVYTAMEGN